VIIFSGKARFRPASQRAANVGTLVACKIRFTFSINCAIDLGVVRRVFGAKQLATSNWQEREPEARQETTRFEAEKRQKSGVDSLMTVLSNGTLGNNILD
jgi:hypothetical protein